MFTDSFESDPNADLKNEAYTRAKTVADRLSQIGSKQQAIATNLLNTVSDSLAGLMDQGVSQDESHGHHHCSGHCHCHNPALPEGASGFASIGTDGQRINNGRNFSASPLKWTRSDGKSDGRGATVVTFAFDDNFGNGLKGISTSEAKSLFTQALQTWASYSPIDFVEVKDPGSGDRVDILAETKSIDGQGKTLAFAYFPTVGDITFDTSENWNNNTFLETAVHELGHSLGLDHENDVDAIMNSVLGRRFDNGKAFLFDDDIKGIRSLYGSGRGSVDTLEEETSSGGENTPPPQPETPAQPNAVNLVKNGSFEDVPISTGQFGRYSQINGWSLISGVGFQVDRRPASSGQAADGTAWVELDALGQNSTIGQNIDTVTGQDYNVSVDFSDGGRPEWTTSVQIFWEGKQIDTLSGGGRGQWRRFDYTLRGGDRSVSTLAFRAIGPNDNVGGFIDNIVVTEARSLVEANEPALGLGSSAADNSSRDPITGERSNLVAESTLIAPFSSESGSFV